MTEHKKILRINFNNGSHKDLDLTNANWIHRTKKDSNPNNYTNHYTSGSVTIRWDKERHPELSEINNIEMVQKGNLFDCKE